MRRPLRRPSRGASLIAVPLAGATLSAVPVAVGTDTLDRWGAIRRLRNSRSLPR
jgi:hypothetical protein